MEDPILRDLKLLHSSIISENKDICNSIFIKYNKSLPLPYVATSNYFRSDTFADVLIPDDVPGTIDYCQLKAVITTGDGSCLYNAASLCLVGDESISRVLRILTAAELFLHALEYANHPKLNKAIRSITNLHKNTVFVAAFSEEGEQEFNVSNNPVKTVEVEAAATAKVYHWSSLINICALSTVVGCTINSLYPKLDKDPKRDNALRPLFHGEIAPIRESSRLGTEQIYILWSRDGNLDNTPNTAFNPNHFTALVHSSVYNSSTPVEPKSAKRELYNCKSTSSSSNKADHQKTFQGFIKSFFKKAAKNSPEASDDSPVHTSNQHTDLPNSSQTGIIVDYAESGKPLSEKYKVIKMVRNPKMDEERSKKKEESSEDESVSSEDSSEDDSTGDEEDEEAHDKEDDLSGNETADKNDNTYDSIPQELSDSIPDNVSSNLPKAFPAEVPLGTENPLAAPSAFSSLAPTTVAPPDMAPAIAVPPGTAQPPVVPPGVTPTIATPIGMAAPTTESPGMAQLPVAPQDMAPPIAAPPGMAQPPVVTPGVAQPPVAPPGMAQPPAVPSGVTPPIATPLGMATPTAAPPGVAQLPVASQDMAPPIAAPPVMAQPPAATPGVAPPITVPLGMAAPTVAPPGMAQPPVAPQGMAPTAAPPVMAPSTVAPPFMAPQTGAPPVAATQPAKSKNMFGGLFKKKAKPTPTAVNPQTALPPPPPLQPSSVPQGNVPPPVPPQTYPAPPPRQMPHQANQRLAPIPRVQPYGPPPPTPPKVQLYEPPPPQQYRPPPPQVPVSEPLTPGLVPMPTPPVPRKTSQPSPPEPAQPEPLPVQALERVPGTSPGGDTPPLIYDPQSSVKKPAKGKPSPSEHPEQSEYPPPGSVRSAQPPPGTDISTQPPPGGIAPPPSKEAPQSQRQVSRPPGGAPEAPRDGATTPLSMASVTSQLSTAGPIGFGIGYMDFIPEPRDKFDVLMSRADGWLRGSTTFKAISFETLNVPLSNEGNVSTDEPLYDVGGDRQYSCVLRMWVKPKTLYDDPAAQRIGYCHLFPHWHQESKRKGKKARMPSCETVDGTLDRCNADFAGSKPLRGHIGTVPFAATHCALRKHLGLGTRIGSVLNMETISHLHAFHQSGTPIHLDPEACTWTDNRKQDVNLLSVIRIYYVIGLDVAQEKIGVQDFVPECTEGKDMTTLETASLVVEAAAGWAKERPWLRVTNIQTIRKIGDDADDHLNTRKMLHRRRSGYPVFYSRFVRMYYTELVDPKDPQGMGLSALQYKDFVPAVQLPSHGKGKKMKVKRIEKTGETMQKLVAWHCLSGHDVVCVETIPLGGKGSLTFDPEENFTWETGHDSADYQLFSFRIFTDASRETDQDSDESVKGSVRGSVKGSVKGSPNGSIASRDYAAWPYGCDQNGFTVPPNTFHSDSQQMVH